jgi:uncharacterized membrane protein HdeD (DUF308 family)
MTATDVDEFRHDLRLTIRRHWILFLIPGVVMIILGLLAAAAPFMATLVVVTFAGWLFLASGFVGLAALFTTKNVPRFIWTLLSAVLAILIGAFLVWRPFVEVITLTLALAAFFAAHGVVQILTSLDHRRFSTLMAVDGGQRHRRFEYRRNHHCELAGERGLGARPARRHQSLHVRSGVGDDRHRLSKRLMARLEALLGFHVGF